MDHDKFGSEVIDLSLAWLEVQTQLRNPLRGVKLSNWPMFSEYMGGLRPREFSILCGATGTGKTSWLANLSANLLTQKIKHLVASVETGYLDFTMRLAEVLLDERIYDDEPKGEQKIIQINSSLEYFTKSNDLKLSVIDNRMSLEHLLQKLTYAHEKLGCRVALLDNLNFFLEITKSSDTIVEMDRVIHEIIMFCKRIDMHVVLVMHPKKTESGRVLSEFDIKGSSTAVQEAQNVFLFNRLDKQTIDSVGGNKYWRELKLAKVRRRGKSTGARILFDGSSPTYKEMGVLNE